MLFGRKNEDNTFSVTARSAVVILTMTTFDMVHEAVNQIGQKQYVLVNLGQMQDSEKQRALDYLGGAMQVLALSAEKVTDDLYLFSPEGACANHGES